MLFQSMSRKNKGLDISLGSPEAEAEALESSRVKITEVYEDWHNLFEQLGHEKFIVIGRKGAGKSAFAQYAKAKSHSDSNLFIDFIKQDKINLEMLVQVGNDVGHELEKESIFKWLIYTHIVKLFTESEAAKDSKDFDQLRQFLKKNTGFVNITETDIFEITQNKSIDVNIEPLKRFFRQKFHDDITIKSNRAPFYKLIPHLEDVIKSIFKSPIEMQNQNSYVIFFDDLDVRFKSTDKASVDSVVSLLRVAKSINNDLFSNNGIHAKVIILLRDDVEKFIADKYADTAKMLASYSARINWYQDDFQKGDNENDLNLKKFIDLRIKKAFERAQLSYNHSNPWNSLVDSEEDYTPKTSFKHILDHTLFRPRDLLLFFQPIESGTIKIPLKKKSVQDLITKYSSQLMREFRSELSSFYTPNEVDSVTNILQLLHKEGEPSYQRALKITEDNYKGDSTPKEVLEDLFDRSAIGNKYSNTYYQFKHREPLDGSDVYYLDPDASIVMHYGFKRYCTSRDKGKQ